MKVRIKVFTDPTTGTKYIASMAVLVDKQREIVQVYLMSDEETHQRKMSIDEYNALPYSYFEEVGPAPAASSRPPDRIAH